MRYSFKIFALVILSLIALRLNAQAPDWQAPSGFHYSMTVTAVLNFSGNESRNAIDKVAAFAGGEVRGVAQPMHESNTDRYYLFMTVYSNQVNGEEITFKLYKESTDMVIEGINKLMFENNKVVGKIASPIVLTNDPSQTGNRSPTDINLSALVVNENETPSIELTTSDLDEGESFTYRLIAGDGDDDNEAFVINNNQLIVTKSFNFEEQKEIKCRIMSTDSRSESFTKSFLLHVRNGNDIPSGVELNVLELKEDSPKNTPFSTLSSIDEDEDDSFTYELVGGAGDDHNALFSITGDQLVVKKSINYEANQSLSVRISTTDLSGASYEQGFQIAVLDVNEAPTSITVGEFNQSEIPKAGGIVASLTTQDQDANDTHIYQLVDGEGSTDNSHFYIQGNKVRSLGTLPQQNNLQFSLRIKSSDRELKSVEEVINSTLILGTNEVAHKINIYPNPITDYVMIGGYEKVSSVQIFDMKGERVGVFSGKERIALSGLSAGSYLIQAIMHDGDVETFKIITK